MLKTDTGSQPTCESCRFYEELGDGEGVCHRYPPIKMGGRLGNIAEEFSQPSVYADVTWCGEHQHGPAPVVTQ